jgi:hypothetical protein
VKERREYDQRREPGATGAEPLAGSGFENEQPETDSNGNSEDSAEPEREDEQ